jgi:hypothetical protein
MRGILVVKYHLVEKGNHGVTGVEGAYMYILYVHIDTVYDLASTVKGYIRNNSLEDIVTASGVEGYLTPGRSQQSDFSTFVCI